MSKFPSGILLYAVKSARLVCRTIHEFWNIKPQRAGFTLRCAAMRGEQEQLSTWAAAIRDRSPSSLRWLSAWGNVCFMCSVRAHFSRLSLCTLQTSRQSRLSRRGSAAPLQIITPPPDTQRHFKSTPPSPRLCASFISLDREEIQLFFSHFLLFPLTHKNTPFLSQLPIHWPRISHRVSTSLSL